MGGGLCSLLLYLCDLAVVAVCSHCLDYTYWWSKPCCRLPSVVCALRCIGITNAPILSLCTSLAHCHQTSLARSLYPSLALALSPLPLPLPFSTFLSLSLSLPLFHRHLLCPSVNIFLTLILAHSLSRSLSLLLPRSTSLSHCSLLSPSVEIFLTL